MLAADEKAFGPKDQINWKMLLEYARQTAAPWAGAGQRGDFSNDYPIVQNSHIPARSMMALMIVFAIVIGPLNMLVLRYKNRRIWMLWTVPTISFVTSMGVFAFAMFSDGIRPTIRTTQFTLLDEGAHRATTLAWLGVFCPLTPGGGMEFDAQTEVTPMMSPMESGSERTIDWTQNQHLTSGWVAARVPTYFMLRKSETRRERLTIEPGADAFHLTVVNGLGGEIKNVTVADKTGRLFSGGPIPAGGRATLSEGVVPMSNTWTLRNNLYNASWVYAMNDAAANPAMLTPGCYLATLADTAFLDDGLGHVSKRSVVSVVYGVPEGVSTRLPPKVGRFADVDARLPVDTDILRYVGGSMSTPN
jgi:hypothetical protein